MSVEITAAFRQEYKSGIEMLVQQMSSQMRKAVREESISSKRAFFDQVGAVAATEATERHGDTQYVSTPHKRRSVSAKTYRVADLGGRAGPDPHAQRPDQRLQPGLRGGPQPRHRPGSGRGGDRHGLHR